ncbi:uncharacterized protein BT62DRAFT_932711 [Guyanagaster necrorhizus]|uniref:N-acetyltransferase domain-containing protein n=1 Tax=Guyanagaster necrorhizus TaxID=856835 RepID=A0A9P8ARU6_9AGAR|nr:uncharacterized protein BT62DRAFT_932711 [Guyanagaster necrorhizus MCA 3950]KAG7445579.1 hypothetical protein BT62DRAFT_932711 [Guyanagaster necrorhizus MCA 3950]
MADDMYETFTLNVPPSESEIDQWIAIRLLALQVDPSSFRTTYEYAKSISREKHIQRIDSHDQVAVIVSHKATGEWIAMSGVASPKILAKLNYPVPEEVYEGRKGSGYLFVSLWVHPEHRRRGLAKKMFDRCIEWARGHDADAVTEKFVANEVYSDNESRGLYRRLGLIERCEVKEPDGNRNVVWLSRSLDEL